MSAQGKTIKQAEAWYRHGMHRLGAQGHSLRRAFAQERVHAYLADGIPIAETLARTSMDMGTVMGAGGESGWLVCLR